MDYRRFYAPKTLVLMFQLNVFHVDLRYYSTFFESVERKLIVKLIKFIVIVSTISKRLLNQFLEFFQIQQFNGMQSFSLF